MKIVIAGAGDVGFHLAKLLSYESKDIILLDNDGDRLEYAKNHIDVMTVKGNAASVQLLEEAGVNSADLFIAATQIETTNITAAIVSKRLGAKRTIARVSNPEYLDRACKVDWSFIGIDNMICPEELASQEILRLIKASAFTDSFEFDGGKLTLIGIHLDPGAPIVDRSIVDVALDNPGLNFMPVAIQRHDHTIIPRGGTVFQEGDSVYLISAPEEINRIVEVTGKKHVNIKNIMILGGSKIGIGAANSLCPDYKVKLIEKDRTKCFDLADDCPRTLIIHGDGRNVELLEEEHISEMDAFIAVTGNSETNIMSCLVAKARGVKKTIALVENMDYIQISQTIGIDTLINKKLIAASNIFRYIREGDVVDLTNLHGVDAEVLEFEVKQNSKITKAPIRDLNFPREAIIGGLIRSGQAASMRNLHVRAGDRVIVFTLPNAISKVESFFK